ncbi:MAG: alkaline phosphatase family protein [Candidatus Acidiferrales bacterium]
MRRRAFLSAVVLFLGVWAAGPLAAQDDTGNLSWRPRLIQIKVDGLSPLLLDALMDPDNPGKLARLPDPEGFRRAIQLFRLETGQRDLLPNFRRYFYEQGARADNMFSATSTLSTVSWAVIETGQPSIVKRHMGFNRNNGYLRGYLDGLRDTLEVIARHSRKTSALWELDQVGVSLLSDAFNPLRRYETPQIYYRLPPGAYLMDWAQTYLTNGAKNPWAILRGHMKRRVEGMDYSEFTEEFLADHLAEKLLEPDFTGGERFDYLTVFFSVDHQHHVDPTPENLVHRLVSLDHRLGRIFRGVERSQRRDQTLVALVSDHGAEYEPGAVNLAFPITRAFRTRYFGGHTVATVMAEDSIHALTTPIMGIDFPRVYESLFSPYGKAAESGGQDNYVTAFIDNFGNARAEVHLRNNDLNRLHLLLLARQRPLDENHRARWRERLRSALQDTCPWLAPEVENYRTYHEAARAWVPELKKRIDTYWRDIATRLEQEGQRDAHQLGALTRLENLCRASDAVAWLHEHHPAVEELIPKKYLGPRNSLYQLTHYTIGLDADLNWVETTVDARGRPVPMNYISLLSDFEVPNPPLSQEANPVDLMVSSLPTEPLRAALVERGWLEPGRELSEVVWIVPTTHRNLRRGGQALLLETPDGQLRYLPISSLEQTAEGGFVLQPHQELDPLGLLYDPEFRSPSSEPAFLWLERFHSQDEWLRATSRTHYSIAPLIVADIAGLHVQRFLENPAFQQTLTGFPSEEVKQQYLRGVAWKYSSQQPDLLLWSSYLWNFASKSHTSGGSHGGLTPPVTRTSFLLWGGRDFHLPAGGVWEEPATTLDVAPTLAHLLRMLDASGRALLQAGAVRERPFLPFAGHALSFPIPELARPASLPGPVPVGPDRR